MRRATGLSSLLTACVACQGPPASGPSEPAAPRAEVSAPPFDHALVHEQPLALRVLAGAAPLEGVRVTVRARRTEREHAPGVLFQGRTDGDGRVRASLALRSDQGEVEVVLQKPGFRGPYDDEALRSQHGAFAPSSRRTVAARALAAMTVALAAVAR